MIDQQPRNKKTESSPSEEGCRVSAALLYHDRFLVPVLLGVLAIPALIEGLIPRLLEGAYIGLIVLDRCLQLLVMFVIAGRARRALGQQHAKHERSSVAALARASVFGFALWSMCTLPLVVAVLSPESSLMVPAIFLLVVGMVWSAGLAAQALGDAGLRHDEAGSTGGARVAHGALGCDAAARGALLRSVSRRALGRVVYGELCV